MAVAVLTLGAAPGLTDAVTSLLDQSPRPEIVVVSSGAADPTPVLEAAGLEVPVIAVPERLFPGAARNRGVAATSAPVVGFLAADCAARPGWCAARLALHGAGAHAVAGVLANPYPHSRSAAAAALLLHHGQMADTPPQRRRMYGLSYKRELFDRLGPFREDLRTGEDTEFKSRLAKAGIEVVRADGALTDHRYPTTPGALVREQYVRGVRQARAAAALGGSTARAAAARAVLGPLLNLVPAWRQAGRAGDAGERRSLRRAWPLLVPAAVAYSAGSLAAIRADSGSRT